MSKVVGTVQAMRRDRKAIQVDGVWYSSYTPINGTVGNGVDVEFDFVTKGSFNNIKGAIVVTGGSAAEPAPSAALVTAAKEYRQNLPEHYQNLNHATLVKSFPVPLLHPDRSIIRQNALNHATQVVLSRSSAAGKNADAVADDIIKTAIKFEAYATGQLELEAINSANKKAATDE